MPWWVIPVVFLVSFLLGGYSALRWADRNPKVFDGDIFRQGNNLYLSPNEEPSSYQDGQVVQFRVRVLPNEKREKK